MISLGDAGAVDIGRHLQVGTCRVALHDRKDQPCAVSRNKQLVRLVFGEDRQRSTTRFEALHVLRLGLSWFHLFLRSFQGKMKQKLGRLLCTKERDTDNWFPSLF